MPHKDGQSTFRAGVAATTALALATATACHKRAALPPPPTPPSAQQPQSLPAPQQQPPAQPENRRLPAAPSNPPQTAPAQPQPEFRLGQTLTPQEQRANETLVDQHLSHASRLLAGIGKRSLTDAQNSLLAQIRGFMDQARQMRATDVVRARSLAERADVLAQDLLSMLK